MLVILRAGVWSAKAIRGAKTMGDAPVEDHDVGVPMQGGESGGALWKPTPIY
jgi:hypothetical protein